MQKLHSLLYERSKHGVTYPGLPPRILWALLLSFGYISCCSLQFYAHTAFFGYLIRIWAVAVISIEWMMLVHRYTSSKYIIKDFSPGLFRAMDFIAGVIIPFVLLDVLTENFSSLEQIPDNPLFSKSALTFLFLGLVNLTIAYFYFIHYKRYPHTLLIENDDGTFDVLPKCDIVKVREDDESLKIQYFRYSLRDMRLRHQDINDFYKKFDPSCFELKNNKVIVNKAFPHLTPIKRYKHTLEYDPWRFLLPRKRITAKKIERCFSYARLHGGGPCFYSPSHYYGLGLSVEIIVEGEDTKNYSGHPVIAWPAPEEQDEADYSMYLSLVNGRPEYRFCKDRYLSFRDCPVTLNASEERIIDGAFLYFYKDRVYKNWNRPPKEKASFEKFYLFISKHLKSGRNKDLKSWATSESYVLRMVAWEGVGWEYVIGGANLPIDPEYIDYQSEQSDSGQLTLNLSFEERELSTPLTDGSCPADMDACISAVKDILLPKYEMRWITESYRLFSEQNFVILPPEKWTDLENRFGKSYVQKYYAPISGNFDLFRRMEEWDIN
ncbi:MAG: hypothetical protein QHC79_25555 [Pseudosphingobacterium sp.]|nr:hypothetical protein [Pseudosphingobacterium sp.]